MHFFFFLRMGTFLLSVGLYGLIWSLKWQNYDLADIALPWILWHIYHQQFSAQKEEPPVAGFDPVILHVCTAGVLHSVIPTLQW